MSRSLLTALAAFLALTLAAAGVASAFTSLSLRTWYPTLRKPRGMPPVFWLGLVWAVLYFLMAVSAWNVWREGDGWDFAIPAIVIFLIQLALNAAWPAIFFGLRAPGWALVEITFLWVAILATVIAFWKTSPLSGAMLLPYLAWVAYAGDLNARIWWLNRDR